jgi:hypothetical protein
MIQGRGGAGFTLETFNRAAILGGLFGQKFQSDAAAQARVFRVVDHAHPTAAKFVEDFIVRYRLADEGG